MQLEIDALMDAAAWPGAGQRTTIVPASRLAVLLGAIGFMILAQQEPYSDSGASSATIRAR